MTRAELPALMAQIATERRRLREVVREIDALARALEGREPTRVELVAAAAFLHTLYTGLEICFVRLARGVDESVPAAGDWHRALVDQLATEIEGLRPALFDEALVARVDELRRFRHAFRHMYFFDLEWTRVRALLGDAAALFGDVEGAIDRLFASVSPPRR